VIGAIPVADTQFNVTAAIEIAVNVTDDVEVGTVLANVTLPNGTIDQLALSLSTGNKYNISFTIPGLTGNFNVTFIANDTSNNINSTEKTNFTAVDGIGPVIVIQGCVPANVNLTQSISCNVSVTDSSEVSAVLANVTLPNGTVELQAVTNVSENYTFTFTNTVLINEYNITWFANDTSGNSNTATSSFNVSDAANPGLVLNSPSNDSISLDNETVLNITVTDNLNTMIVKIYGGNETGFFNNNSLLYKRTGVANNTEITYNWTAPVLNVTADIQLLMHFDLEGSENATFIEDETGINNGTKKAVGEPVWNESGKFGLALGFDGVDDSVSIVDSNSLDLNNSFSIGFWVFPRNLAKNQTFLVKGSSTTVNYFIDYITTDEIEFGFYNGAFRSISVDASSLTVNEWSQIVVTLNDTSNISRVYINGVDKGSLQLDFDVLANALDLKLGHFPGFDQNFSGMIDELVIYNKTLSSNEVTNIYRLKEGDWYWKVEVNDSSSNLNISEIRVFTIGSIWDVSPTDLGTIGVALSTNVSVGTLTINNTHPSRNVTINITHDFNGTVTFNETLPFSLTNTNTGNNTQQIQINVTSPSTEGSTDIVFNITATDADLGGNSVPALRTVSVTLISTASSAFLVSNFETVPSSVSQGETSISLVASVTNNGQGDAQAVILNFSLPSGWTNTSGALSQSLGIILSGGQKNASITVNVSENATTGTVTLYANVSGQNSSGTDLNSSFITVGTADVTVNAVTAGAGPSTTTTTTTGGGGGRSSSSGGVTESVAFSEAIEVVRGADGVSFDIIRSIIGYESDVEITIQTRNCK